MRALNIMEINSSVDTLYKHKIDYIKKFNDRYNTNFFNHSEIRKYVKLHLTKMLRDLGFVGDFLPLFVHIPKNAGKSVAYSLVFETTGIYEPLLDVARLFGFDKWTHRPLNVYAIVDPELFFKCKPICFIDQPYNYLKNIIRWTYRISNNYGFRNNLPDIREDFLATLIENQNVRILAPGCEFLFRSQISYVKYVSIAPDHHSIDYIEKIKIFKMSDVAKFKIFGKEYKPPKLNSTKELNKDSACLGFDYGFVKNHIRYLELIKEYSKIFYVSDHILWDSI